MSPHSIAKRWLRDCVVLDTETTGLEEDDEIIEIALVDQAGQTLLSTLVQPTTVIRESATSVHGITSSMVATAPSWPKIHDQVSRLLQGKTVISFNAEFDYRMLSQTAQKHGLLPPVQFIHCAMKAFAQYFGDWDDRFEDWKWQSLSNAARQLGIARTDRAHRALADCRTTLAVLQAMAREPFSRRRHLDKRAIESYGVCFRELVDAVQDYAKFSGWTSTRTAAIGRVTTWLTSEYDNSWAGKALQWKRTGIDGLASWKRDKESFVGNVSSMSLEEVTEALDSGDDVNERDAQGNTPLLRVLHSGRIDLRIALLLMQRGADVRATRHDGATALHLAATQPPTLVAELIKSGCDVNALDHKGRSPLWYAINWRDRSTFDSLLAAGAAVRSDSGQQSLLHLAALKDPSFLPAILDAGEDANLLDKQGRTALHSAVLADREEDANFAIRLLVECGTNIEAKTRRGDTALVLAIEKKRPISVIKQLLECGANVNCSNGQGTTPLHVAAKVGASKAIIRALLDAGADYTARDRKGRVPKDYLAERHDERPGEH